MSGTGWEGHASRGTSVPINLGMRQLGVGRPFADGTFRTEITIPPDTPEGRIRITAIIGNGGGVDAYVTVTAEDEAGYIVSSSSPDDLSINMSDACQVEYGGTDLSAETSSSTDPYRWSCYRGLTPVGGLPNLDVYCSTKYTDGKIVLRPPHDAHSWRCRVPNKPVTVVKPIIPPEPVSRSSVGGAFPAIPPDAECAIEVIADTGALFFPPLAAVSVGTSVYAILGDIDRGEYYRIPIEFIPYSSCAELIVNPGVVS